MNAGRPTLLDDHLFRKIKDLVLEKKNLREISEILEIPYATMRDWEYENYKGFSDKMLSFKHERILKLAETNLEVLLEGEDERIRSDLTKFALETLNKKHYSKRVDSDVTTGGDKIVFLPNQVINKLNGTTQETSGDNQL